MRQAALSSLIREEILEFSECERLAGFPRAEEMVLTRSLWVHRGKEIED